MTDPDSTIPSIKGTALAPVVENFKALVAAGRIDGADQSTYLDASDRELLDGVVAPVAWYPLDSYRRLMELIAQKEAPDGHEAFFIARGRIAAEKLMGGVYKSFAGQPGSWGMRAGETMTQLAPMIFNVGKWKFRGLEEDVFEVEVSGAEGLPDVARFTTEGFLGFVADAMNGSPVMITSARPSPDRLIYRLSIR